MRSRFSAARSPPKPPAKPPPSAVPSDIHWNIDDQQFMELDQCPVINPGAQVVQVIAVVWDATGTRLLQQKIDAIDKAGRELVKLEGEALSKLNVGCRHSEAAGRQDHQLHAGVDAFRSFRDPPA